MPAAPLPCNEPDRIRALLECNVLDTPSETVFDDLTRLAAKFCGTPIALVSLVDRERQWFKSAYGINAQETHRDSAFCAHAILQNEVFIISDASTDPRTKDNALVLGPPYIRFYAGIPLRTKDQFPLGTLCVIDTVPRQLTDDQMDDFNSLARQAASQLELRRTNVALDVEKNALTTLHERQLQISSQLPGVVYQYLLKPDGTSCFPFASEGIREIYRVSPAEVSLDATCVYNIIHPEDVAEVKDSIQQSAKSLSHWRQEYRVKFPNDEVRWLSGNAMPVRRSDGSVLWHGFITDVTQQRKERDEAQKTRANLQAVFDAATQVAIIATDCSGTITAFNSGAERLLGYAANEMIDCQSPIQFHLESQVEARGAVLSRETGRQLRGFDVFVENARHGRHDEREWTLVHKDGKQVIVRLAVTSIRDNENSLTGFLLVASDVTAMRNTQRELAEERERLDLALTGGQLGTWDWNLQTGGMILDGRWAEIVGEPVDQLPSNYDAWRLRVHRDDLANIHAKVQEHNHGLAPAFEAQYRLRHADGGWRWVIARGRLMESNKGGQPQRMVGTVADITLHVQTQQALRENETRIRTMAAVVESSDDAILSMDLNGKILSWNNGAERVFAYSAEEAIGQHAIMLCPTELQSDQNEIISKLSYGNIIEPFETVRLCKDGRRIEVSIKVSPILDVDGKFIGSSKVVRDITKSQKTSAALQRSERLLQDFFENGNVGLHWVSGDGTIIRANRAELEMLGYTREEYIGQNISKFHADQEVIDQILLRLSRGDDLSSCSAKLKCKDGTIRDVEINSSVFWDEGNFVHTRCFTRDVTKEKLAEKRRVEQSQLASLRADIGVALTRRSSLREFLRGCCQAIVRNLDASFARIWTISQSGDYLELETSEGSISSVDVMQTRVPVAELKLALRSTERMPLSIGQVVGDFGIQDREWVSNRGKHAFTAYPLVVDDAIVGVWELFARHPLQEGTLGNLGAIADSVAIGIQRKQTELDLEQAKSDAETASQSKSDFLANMSHEIRTPLTAILGFADLLSDRSLSDDDFRNFLSTIQRSGKHLQTIICDILDLSKIEAGKMTFEKLACSPNDLVREAVCFFGDMVRSKGLTLQTEIAGTIPASIRSDPVRVRQILINLIGNAIKFTEQGEVRVVIRRGTDISRGEPTIAFDVIDTGIGMTDLQVAGLFSPFVQADNSTTRRFGGTGLGLTISKRMALLLGGNVTVVSAPGVGSSFTLEIAMDLGVPEDQEKKIDMVESLPIRRATQLPLSGHVLLVEDGKDNQLLLRTILMKAGAHVDLAEDGVEAIEFVKNRGLEPSSDGTFRKEWHACYDLILMDMQMPRKDGCSATSELRDLGYTGPILALTANAMDQDRQKCLAAGCDDFVTKPIERDVFIEKCRQWMNRTSTIRWPSVRQLVWSGGAISSGRCCV